MFLRLNVGGRSCRIRHELVKSRYETGYLAKFARLSHEEKMAESDAYVEEQEEYYFERSPTLFEYVLDYYVTGRLHRPLEVCEERYLAELEFWRLPPILLASCCKLSQSQSNGKVSDLVETQVTQETDEFELLIYGKERRALWAFLENPSSSIAAKFFAILSVSFVLISVSALIIGSIPDCQVGDEEPHESLVIIEYVCMGWFTIEYCIRILVAPDKISFVKTPLNVIDLLTIAPFYAELCLPLIGVKAKELAKLKGAMVVMRIIRVARVARIFKLARYSTGLQAFGDTMMHSLKELGMLSMFLITGIILFSTIMYFLEKDEPGSEFYSIPAACWWCVITMTTVGYGDLVPKTPAGKAVAAVASVCGIVVLAFPISMIIDKFAESARKQEPPTKDSTEGSDSQVVVRRKYCGKFGSSHKSLAHV